VELEEGDELGLVAHELHILLLELLERWLGGGISSIAVSHHQPLALLLLGLTS
jgi:hypothetical protein